MVGLIHHACLQAITSGPLRLHKLLCCGLTPIPGPQLEAIGRRISCALRKTLNVLTSIRYTLKCRWRTPLLTLYEPCTWEHMIMVLGEATFLRVSGW